MSGNKITEDQVDALDKEELIDEVEDDSSFADDDWDEFEEEEMAYQEPPPKKKSSFSTILVIAVVLLGGLGFLYFQSGSGDHVSPVAVSDPVQESAGFSADVGISPETSPVPAPVPAQQAGLLTPMPEETLVVDAPEEIVAPEVSNVPSPLTDAPDLMADRGGDNGLTVIQPVSDFPSVDMIKKESGDVPAVAGVTVVQETISSDSSVVPVAAETTLPSADSVAKEKIKMLEDSLALSAKDAESYKNQVQLLTDKVADLEDALIEANKAAERAAEEARLSSAKQSAQQEKAVSPSIAQTNVEKSAQPQKGKAEKEEVLPVSSAVQWELRGAQSGRALLSAANGGSSDVWSVSVGERVPGLGQILSIEQGQNGWVVLGTVGKVTE